jgi:hypothetical protein
VTSAQLVVLGGSLATAVEPLPGFYVVTWSTRVDGQQVTLATGSRSTSKPGAVHLDVRLTARGKRLLNQASRDHAELVCTATVKRETLDPVTHRPEPGTTAAASRTITLKPRSASDWAEQPPQAARNAFDSRSPSHLGAITVFSPVLIMRIPHPGRA